MAEFAAYKGEETKKVAIKTGMYVAPGSRFQTQYGCSYFTNPITFAYPLKVWEKDSSKGRVTRYFNLLDYVRAKGVVTSHEMRGWSATITQFMRCCGAFEKVGYGKYKLSDKAQRYVEEIKAILNK